MAKRVSGYLHRKGSVARAIQDYFLRGCYQDLIDETSNWCWFPIPNNPDLCVGLTWQGDYETDDTNKEMYGRFMSGEYVINYALYDTAEFALNGKYAYYAEYYYNESADDELCGGCSLAECDVKDRFYEVSKNLAEEFNKYNKMKRRRS